MNLTQVRKILEIAWRLKVAGTIPNMPIFTLVGDTGIGKSALINDFYESIRTEHGADFFECKYLAQVEVGDLIGMPDRQGNKTVWLAPDWWPEIDSKGLLFLDELADAKTDVRAAVMPMLLTGKLHQNRLPKELLIVCAMNPVGGDFGGYTFSRQFKDRLAFLKVSSTIEEWLAFANKAGMPLYVRNMISEQPGFFLDQKTGTTADGDWTTNEYYSGTPSRRSVTVATQIFEQLTDEEKETVGIDLLSAIAGEAAAASIMTYSRRTVTELVNPKDIYDETKSLQLLITIGTWVENNSIERLGSFARLIKAMLKADGISKEQTKPLANLVAMLPEDISVGILTFIKSEVKNAQMVLLSMAQDKRVFSRIDKMINPHKYKNAPKTVVEDCEEVAA